MDRDRRTVRNTATHGLVSFFTFDPSPVMKLNGSNRRGVTYLSGSIVEAEKGFRVDPSCFLYLPLRIVITEAADGTAVLGLDAPADLFAVFPGSELAEVGGRIHAYVRATATAHRTTGPARVHRRYMDVLLDSGNLVAGGPYEDGSGALFIYQAASTAEAEAIVAADPYSQNGAIAHYQLKAWEVVKADPALLPDTATRVAGPQA